MSIVNDLAALAMPSLICSIMEGVEFVSVGAVEVVLVAGSPANLYDCVSQVSQRHLCRQKHTDQA